MSLWQQQRLLFSTQQTTEKMGHSFAKSTNVTRMVSPNSLTTEYQKYYSWNGDCKALRLNIFVHIHFEKEIITSRCPNPMVKGNGFGVELREFKIFDREVDSRSIKFDNCCCCCCSDCWNFPNFPISRISVNSRLREFERLLCVIH